MFTNMGSSDFHKEKWGCNLTLLNVVKAVELSEV